MAALYWRNASTAPLKLMRSKSAWRRATASAITMSTLLVRFALLMGVVGVAMAVLGLTFPDLAAF